MPTEKQIKQRVRDELGYANYICWFPPPVRFLKKDIFGCFDVICWKRDGLRLIQYTTAKNIKAREKKIRDFMELYQLKTPKKVRMEVWGAKGNEFKIVKLNEN